MERKLEFNSQKRPKINGDGKSADFVPCEKPKNNGSKPSKPERTAEECKKHIRRDGRK